MRHFVQANISCESEMTIKYFLNMWSRFNESLIFIFVGVVTVAGPQVWNWTFITLTVILCVVARVIAVVGLTFLTNKFHSVKLTKEDQFLFACSGLRGAVAFFLAFLLETDHFPEREIFVTAIITVIFFTVFVQVFHRLGLHIDGVCGDNGHHHRMDKLKQFSDRYLKKWLIVGEGTSNPGSGLLPSLEQREPVNSCLKDSMTRSIIFYRIHGFCFRGHGTLLRNEHLVFIVMLGHRVPLPVIQS
ncbi:Na(+)/H(+) exchanger beta-like isoform X2 [Oreochromis niloticus]|uniref:Na(+)/H(+) exchanger beta-like isoform X2 n=1 Tax=Oreochromis niloticus TaxID=8128 RepID=UPI000DF46C27|nr:Na(+)/H(+) exchanger beta-like isoform X2 [Oreochromis niloticus]